MTTSRTVDNTLLLWAECLSNISVGALLSESVANPDANRSRSMLQNNSTLQHALVNFDSFDAAIAAHIARYQVADMPAKPASQPILEAEDTCHAFPFQKITPVQATADSCNVAHFTSCAQNISSNSIRPDETVKLCLLFFFFLISFLLILRPYFDIHFLLFLIYIFFYSAGRL